MYWWWIEMGVVIGCGNHWRQLSCMVCAVPSGLWSGKIISPRIRNTPRVFGFFALVLTEGGGPWMSLGFGFPVKIPLSPRRFFLWWMGRIRAEQNYSSRYASYHTILVDMPHTTQLVHQEAETTWIAKYFYFPNNIVSPRQNACQEWCRN